MTSEIATPRPGTYLRALGLRERCLYVYTERNPLHFLLVAEFDISLDEHRVRDGLFAVQCRHPLLTAHIRDDPESGPGLYRRDPVPAIDLTVRNDVEQDWQPLAAAELTRPFDPATAPHAGNACDAPNDVVAVVGVRSRHR